MLLSAFAFAFPFAISFPKEQLLPRIGASPRGRLPFQSPVLLPTTTTTAGLLDRHRRRGHLLDRLPRETVVDMVIKLAIPRHLRKATDRARPRLDCCCPSLLRRWGRLRAVIGSGLFLRVRDHLSTVLAPPVRFLDGFLAAQATQAAALFPVMGLDGGVLLLLA